MTTSLPGNVTILRHASVFPVGKAVKHGPFGRASFSERAGVVRAAGQK
jgi:hypothetical protein